MRQPIQLPGRYDSTRPLFSVHIPKCGGTSVAANLAHWFGDGLKYHYADEAAGTLPVKWPLTRGLCVHGHFNNTRGFGVSDYYPEASQFVTFLRDPLEMHLSLYFYLKQNSGHSYKEGKRYDITAEFPDVDAFIEGVCRDREHFFALSFLRYLPGRIAPDNLEETLFARFLHVGITADLGNSVAILARKLGRDPLPADHLNAAPRDEEIDYGRFVELHRKHYFVEHEIYRHALEVHRRETQEYEGSMR